MGMASALGLAQQRLGGEETLECFQRKMRAAWNRLDEAEAEVDHAQTALDTLDAQIKRAGYADEMLMFTMELAGEDSENTG